MLYKGCLYKSCRVIGWLWAAFLPMQPLRQRLGRAVRRLRRAAGYSQEAFADHVRVHRTYMGAIERGEVNVSLDNIERVAAALGMTPDRLLAEAEAERGRVPEPPDPGPDAVRRGSDGGAGSVTPPDAPPGHDLDLPDP
jgi:DNA-binding XRE family transcriptional regulator